MAQYMMITYIYIFMDTHMTEIYQDLSILLLC